MKSLALTGTLAAVLRINIDVEKSPRILKADCLWEMQQHYILACNALSCASQIYL